MKVVINNCFGGFGLSPLAVKEYCKLKGFEIYMFTSEFINHELKLFPLINVPEGNSLCIHYKKTPNAEDKESDNYFSDSDIERNDPDLIKVIKKLGEKANGLCAELKIVEIPDGADYEISEYDGNEHIAEKHKTWY